MHEGAPYDNEHQDDQTNPEEERKAQPRIYVASLVDYNEGRLHGEWIDAAQDEEELERCVKEMLARSPSPGAEEWAIHDYEGFGLLRLDEFESLASVAKVASGIAEHGPAFAAWAAHVGADSEAIDEFEDAYMGEWESAVAFAGEMLDDMGHIEEIMRGVPAHLAAYVQIDYEGFVRDLVRNGELATLEKPDGGIYVFRNW
jgi:antirestriction protein